MSQNRERSRLFDMQFNSLHGDDRSLFMRPPEYSTRRSPQDNSPSSHPYANADARGAVFSQESDLNRGRDMGTNLDESLASLQLSVNSNHSLSNGRMCNSNYGRTNSINTDFNQHQYVPGTINPMLTSEFGNERSFGAHGILTPSQFSNGADSSAWLYLGHQSQRSSSNLCLPTYTSHMSSGATHSQYSDSAWETDPSLCAEDDDTLPLPDENSASMQSYNHPRTGIWAQEDLYEQDTGYSTMKDIGQDIGSGPTMTQTIPQSLQQFINDAEAATFSGTQSYSHRDGSFMQAGLGANRRPETTAPLFTPQPASRYPVPQFPQPPMSSRSGVSIVIDNASDFQNPSDRQPIGIERSFYPHGSDQSSSSSRAPRITLDDPHLAAPTMTSTPFMNPPTLAPSPSNSADTSNSMVEECRVCQAKFTGTFRKDTLRRHDSLEHGNKEKPICPVCKRVFRSGRLDNVKRHIKAKHPGHPLPASRNIRTRRTTPRRRRL